MILFGFVYTPLNVKKVLFRIIQFSLSIVLMSKRFYFQQFSIAYKEFNFKLFSLAYVRSLNVKTVLFQTIQFGLYEVLPLQTRVDHVTMAMKR